eukprot:gene638-8141_t
MSDQEEDEEFLNILQSITHEIKQKKQENESSVEFVDKKNGENIFCCDNSIGKVTKHLRLLGVDCICEPELSNFLLFKCLNEGRIVLSNREKIIKKLEKHNNPKVNKNEIYSSDDEDDEQTPKYKYYLVKGKSYEDQLDEITNEFKIEFKEEFLYSRCLKYTR